MGEKTSMRLQVDAHSPIPIRRQLTEQLKHAIEGGGVPRNRALPSIRELAGFLGINPNTVARVIEDLKQSGYVAAAADRVRQMAGSATQVLIDDRALEPRAIQMLAALLVKQDGNAPSPEAPAPPGRSGRPAQGAGLRSRTRGEEGSRRGRAG
jgi:GntR family transcriptional regulator